MKMIAAFMRMWFYIKPSITPPVQRPVTPATAAAKRARCVARHLEVLLMLSRHLTPLSVRQIPCAHVAIVSLVLRLVTKTLNYFFRSYTNDTKTRRALSSHEWHESPINSRRHQGHGLKHEQASQKDERHQIQNTRGRCLCIPLPFIARSMGLSLLGMT
jgi:hypothetical protein